MTETGGLDFEANFEVIFTGLLDEVLEHRLQAFQDLVDNHKLSQKASPDGKGGKAFGSNVCLWRLIANGQMFNQRFLHPWNRLEHFHQESVQCNALLDEWIADANQISRWGTLIIRNDVNDFPAQCFTFSPNIGFGPAKLKAHPHLHPTRYQSWPKDVTVYVPAKGPLPMGSFCGADGYGLIQPNTINAAVLQCCIASSKESPHHFKFDAMALTPNLDLMMSCKDAERVAQTIVQWNGGASRTDKLEKIKPPGADMPTGSVGTEDWNVHVFSQQAFRHWAANRRNYGESDRRVDREKIGEVLKASEASLFLHVSILVTQMGANLRAYHFLHNQEILGLKKVERITLLEVKEVLDQIVEWKWVNPAPLSQYEKYLPASGGDLNMTANDFKGRKRLKVLWEVTGYEVARASWSEPKTKEQYLEILAVFWRMHQYCCHHCQELGRSQQRLDPSRSLRRCGKKKTERHASTLR